MAKTAASNLALARTLSFDPADARPIGTVEGHRGSAIVGARNRMLAAGHLAQVGEDRYHLTETARDLYYDADVHAAPAEPLPAPVGEDSDAAEPAAETPAAPVVCGCGRPVTEHTEMEREVEARFTSVFNDERAKREPFGRAASRARYAARQIAEWGVIGTRQQADDAVVHATLWGPLPAVALAAAREALEGADELEAQIRVAKMLVEISGADYNTAVVAAGYARKVAPIVNLRIEGYGVIITGTVPAETIKAGQTIIAPASRFGGDTLAWLVTRVSVRTDRHGKKNAEIIVEAVCDLQGRPRNDTDILRRPSDCGVMKGHAFPNWRPAAHHPDGFGLFNLERTTLEEISRRWKSGVRVCITDLMDASLNGRAWTIDNCRLDPRDSEGPTVHLELTSECDADGNPVRSALYYGGPADRAVLACDTRVRPAAS